MIPGGRAAPKQVRRLPVATCLSGALPLLFPFAILICDRRWEMLATAACVSAFLLPGLLMAHCWFGPNHPLGQLPGRFSTAMVLALLPFGLVGALSTKLHWAFSTFLAVYAAVYLATAGVLFAVLVKRARGGTSRAEEWPRFDLPSSPRRWTGLLLLAGAALAMTGSCLGYQADTRPWWHWTSVGLAAGVTTLVILALVWRRSRLNCAPPAKKKAGRRGKLVIHQGAEQSPAHERVLAIVLWLGVGAVTVYLMQAAYVRPHWDGDDVTYVSRAVDFLTGEPMDRYESSLGEPTPMDPGFLLATTSLLGAAISWVTDIECSVLMHRTLVPLFALAGISSLAAVLAVLTGRNRLLVPLGLLVALGVLAKSVDGPRSVVEFLTHRAAQPKSVHLGVVLPIQLAALVLSVTRPCRRHTWFAIALALAGHLIHPWSTAVQLVWSGTLGVAALLLNRRAFGHLAAVVAATVVIGGLHQLAAKYDPLGTGESRAVAPVLLIEVAQGDDGARPVLDAPGTIGRYTLFRLGILAIPFVLLLGVYRRECLLVGLVSLAALALAFVEPLGVLYSKAVPIGLLWRTRWMVTSALNGALLGVCLYWAVAITVGRAGGWRRSVGSLVGVAVTLAATTCMLHFNSSRYPRRGGPVDRLSKFSPAAHTFAEALGGAEGSVYLLAPPPPVGLARSLGGELCQLMPKIRLILTRRLVVEWFFGPQEQRRRTALLNSFYSGRMTPAQFRRMQERFPVDHAIVDYRWGRGNQQAQLLGSLGWQRELRVGRRELWRAPGLGDLTPEEMIPGGTD